MENQIYSQPLRQDSVPFSASLAASFFPNHFVQPPTTFSGSTKVPCNLSVTVNSTELALNLLAIAFWYLRENSLIRFAPAARQGLVFTYTPIVVEINRLSQQRIPGLEYDLIEVAKQFAPGATIEQIVYQFFETTVEYTQEKIFRRMTQWIVQLGYGPFINEDPVTPEEAKRFFKYRNMKSFDFRFAPDCQRIAGTQPAAQQIHQGWMKFQTEESELFRQIYAQGERAMKSRTYQSTGSDSFGDF